jgi:hypothetical protein
MTANPVRFGQAQTMLARRVCAPKGAKPLGKNANFRGSYLHRHPFSVTLEPWGHVVYPNAGESLTRTSLAYP